MSKQLAKKMLRPLRGPHVFIMMAYLIAREAMTVEELVECTGLSDDVIRPALKYLQGEGHVSRQVLAHGRVTWLPAGDSFLSDLFGQSPRFADSTDVVVVVESEESHNLLSTTTTNMRQSPRFAEPGMSADQLLNLAALKDAGIKGRNARRLAALPWVNVEYINAHAEQVKYEFWDNPQGMMISRIEDEEQPEEPAAEKRGYHKTTIDRGKRGIETVSFTWDVEQEISDYMGHEKGCRCSECQWIIANQGRLDVVCPDCKHHECECEESEEEE